MIGSGLGFKLEVQSSSQSPINYPITITNYQFPCASSPGPERRRLKLNLGRPAADLRQTARDAVHILAPRIAGARFLDGYAGTGAVGIEALSRGAISVTFVESDRRAETLIAENLAHCGVENGYAIIRATVARAIDQLDAAAFGPYELFDIVWFDPPYDEQPDAVLAAAGVLIAAGGLLVLEHARRRPARARTWR